MTRSIELSLLIAAAACLWLAEARIAAAQGVATPPVTTAKSYDEAAAVTPVRYNRPWGGYQPYYRPYVRPYYSYRPYYYGGYRAYAPAYRYYNGGAVYRGGVGYGGTYYGGYSYGRPRYYVGYRW